MNVRLIGVCFVVVACGLLGFKFASDLRFEMKALRDLIDILNYMEWELHFRLTPLPQLCRASAEHSRVLKRIFLCFAQELESQISPDTVRCMEAAIHQYADLSQPVRPYLLEFGSSCGKFDLEGQLSGIDAVRRKCAQNLESLEKDKDIRVRNYQTLGLCAGAALAILLL